MDEILLGIVLAVVINGAFDAIVVAWIAAKRSPGAFDRWVRSEKAKPALHVISQAVREEVIPDLPSASTLKAEIDQVRVDMGRMHAELSAEMPPNIDGRVAEMETKLDAGMVKLEEATKTITQIDQGLGAAFSALDTKLGVAFGTQGASQKALQTMAGQVSEDMSGALQTAVQGLDTSNPLVRQWYMWASKPMDEKWAAKHPLEAMVVQAGKTWVGQNIIPQLAGGEGFPANPGTDIARVSKGSKIL